MMRSSHVVSIVHGERDDSPVDLVAHSETSPMKTNKGFLHVSTHEYAGGYEDNKDDKHVYKQFLISLIKSLLITTSLMY